MPTYSYECKDCGHTYDAFQAMKDDPHTVCPQCGGKVERLIGAGAGIVFKGSGFYVTDYKKSGSDSKTGSGEKSSSNGSTPAALPPAASGGTAPAAPSTTASGGSKSD